MGVRVGEGRRKLGAVTDETPAVMGHGSSAIAFLCMGECRERIVEGETPAVMDHGSGPDNRLQAADGCMGEWEREEEKRG